MNEILDFGLNELKRIADSLVKLSEDETLSEELRNELFYHAMMIISAKLSIVNSIYEIVLAMNNTMENLGEKQ